MARFVRFPYTQIHCSCTRQIAPLLSLKIKLQGHLDSARPHGHTRDRAESAGRRDVAGRRGEARMVRQVEKLRAEQEVPGFRHVELFAHVEIQADEVRRVLCRFCGIAERGGVGRTIDAKSTRSEE